MATPTLLKLSSDSKTIRAIGSVYRRPREDNDDPVLTPVHIRSTISVVVDLEPGAYVFLFFLDAGAGKVEVRAEARDGGAVFGTRKVDTAVDGVHRHALRFEVREEGT